MSETFRSVRIFVAAYEERSFTAAADREHATQSGVSQHIRKLEQRFGVQLFSRESARVTPTAAADAYYLRCVEMLRLNEAASAEISRYGKGLNGEIAVGLMPTMTRCALAPALERFSAANPNVNVRVVEGYSAFLMQQVRAGALDFAIVPTAAGMIGLRSRPFLSTPEVLVRRADAAAGRPGAVRLRDLGPLKILLPSATNARHQRLKDYFAANSVTIERVMELDSMMGTLDYIARGDWVAILPQIMTARDLAPRLMASPIVDPGLQLDLVLVEPASRPISPAADAMFAVLKAETAALNTA
jgi:DNA-binding transcriptional LysR family regulator